MSFLVQFARRIRVTKFCRACVLSVMNIFGEKVQALVVFTEKLNGTGKDLYF